MLKEVQRNDTILCIDMWQQCNDDPTLPIPDDKDGSETPKYILFQFELLDDRSTKLTLYLKVTCIIPNHIDTNLDEEHETID